MSEVIAATSEKEDEEERVVRSGKYGVIANAVNFIGGVSFLGLPFAIKESGLIGGLCLMGLVAVLTEWSHRLIVESSKFHHKLQFASINSYEALVATPFGRVGEMVLLFSVFVVAFGACVVSNFFFPRDNLVQSYIRQAEAVRVVTGIHRYDQGSALNTTKWRHSASSTRLGHVHRTAYTHQGSVLTHLCICIVPGPFGILGCSYH